MSTTIGTVRALALRPARAAPPVAVNTVQALPGLGLAGDVHADSLSPRQVLLASAGVLDALALPAHALRENLLADLDTAALASGTVLQIGDAARLRLMFQCESCGRLDILRPGLAQALAGRRGMLARVLAGGAIRPGDRIRDLGRPLARWSDDWRERVRQILDAVPQHAAIDFGTLARLAGVQASYCRAFPALLRKLGPAYARRAVPLRAAGDIVRWDAHGLFDQAP